MVRMRPTRRRGAAVRIAVLLAVLAGILAACGSEEPDDGSDGDDAAASDPSDDTSDGDAGDDGDAGGDGDAGDDGDTPQSGGRLVFGAFTEIEGLDPIHSGGSASTNGLHGRAVFDALMRTNEDNETVPYLAESLESDDGELWTLTLREGVEFSDGTPLDADAVVYNLERHRDPELGSQSHALMEPITRVEAVDELTVEIETAFSWAALPRVLSQGVGWIGSPTAIEERGEDFNLNPVGAGPFVVEEWNLDQEMVLVRNDNYWQDGLPYLDELVFRPISDFQTRYASVRTGDIDMMYDVGAPEQLAQAKENEDLVVHEVIGNGGELLMLNTDVAPFDDVRVRRALAHTLDYDTILEIRHGGRIPAGVGVFSPDSPWYSGVEWPETDLDKARELLDDYLADTGQEQLTVTFGMISDRQEYAQLVQQLLSAVDINVEIELFDIAEYVPRVFSGNYGFTAWAQTHFIEPDLDLYRAFHSESARNGSNFSTPELDAALEKGRSSLDLETRQEAYAEVEEILADQMPYLYTNRSASVLVVGDHVRGLDPANDLIFSSATLWSEQ